MSKAPTSRIETRSDLTADMIERLRLARAEGVGPITYRRLLRRYGSPAAALDALPALARAGGRAEPPRVPSEAAARREIEQTARLGARLLFLDGPDYPMLLGLLEDPPPVIAVLGRQDAFATRPVALVGGRNASANGQRMAEHLGEGLATAGLVVVSGLARGVDAAAHAGALRSGLTIACIAGGIDVVYPPQNARLHARIAAEGAIVAEAPLATAPQARHFPRRNRVIAGLSLGIVVIEAAQRSGSLITARLGLEAGRELFAVPGSPLDPRCSGSNDLLRKGAHVTETPADVLENLPDHPGRQGLGRSPLFARYPGPSSLQDSPVPFERFEPLPDSRDELARARLEVVDLLQPAPTSVDELIRRCQLSAASVMSVLLELEIAGRVETLPGGHVALLGTPQP